MNDSLHNRALELVRIYKQTEADLLEVFQLIDGEKVFLRLGYGSMFDYAVKALCLAEGTAYNFINVSRKIREVPELGEAIRAGAFTVAKARKITAVLTKENQSQWIPLAQHLSQHALEREVAKASPMSAVREHAKYVQEDRVALGFAVSGALYGDLCRIQDLESTRQRKPVTMEQAFAAMAEFYLERKDPLRRAAQVKIKKSSQQFSRTVPAELKHRVYLRDRGRCQYQGCSQTRWTEIHHIKPRSKGGSHELENLTTLCSAHHKLLHRSDEEEHKEI